MVVHHLTYQFSHMPGSIETHGKENVMEGKSGEGLSRWMWEPQSYGKPYTACLRGFKTTTKLIQFLQGWSKLETSPKTMRHLKLLLCPSPSPGNSFRSSLVASTVEHRGTAPGLVRGLHLHDADCFLFWQGSQATWLNSALPKLAEIIRLQDLGAIKMEVATLASTYPDIR